MAKKQEQENAADMLRQFDSLKQKHPDAMLLFRKGNSTSCTGRMR